VISPTLDFSRAISSSRCALQHSSCLTLRLRFNLPQPGVSIIRAAPQLEPPREAASFALSALPSPYHQCARTWRGETVRTVRIVRARDSPLCSNGFASCPAVDGRRTQWMVLPGTVRGNHLKSNGGALADGADANIDRRSGQQKITTPPGPGGHKRGREPICPAESAEAA
jgi:hypothetical protein